MAQRDRNFSITYPIDASLVEHNLETGVSRVSYEGQKQNQRHASLVVANPWRAKRPVSPLVYSPTPRTLTYYSRSEPYGTSYYAPYGSQHPIRMTYTGTCSGPNATWERGTQSVRPQLLNEAIIDAMQKLKDQNWNAGVAAAEASGIARMLTDALRAVTRARTALQAGNLQKAYERFRKDTGYMSYSDWRKKYWHQVKNQASVRKNRRIPSDWLYYHYGIKPTIDDIDGAVQEFIRGARETPHYFHGTVQGYAKSKQVFTTPDETVNSVILRSEHNNLESVRVVLFVRPKDNSLANRLNQLGATNPAEALWNGTPYSFVVDYFYSVGDWLSVLDTHVAWDFDERVLECYRNVMKIDTKVHYGPTCMSVNFADGWLVQKTLDRKVHVSVYGPTGMILPMRKRGGLSAMTVSKLLSLAATAFKMPPRP